jgi:hypothetical protein
MPYPNSQSPLTVRLNSLFRDIYANSANRPPYFPTDPPAQAISELTSTTPLAEIASLLHWRVARNPGEAAHLRDWPKDQQDQVRAVMLAAVTARRPITFDWEQAVATTVSVLDIAPDQPISITFRSPLVYPPYST